MKILPPYTDFSQRLPQSLLSVVNALRIHFQVDGFVVIPVILGMLSALVHDKCKVRVYDYLTGSSFDEPLSLFCIGIANSSERKGPTFKWLKAPIEEKLESIKRELQKELTRALCERKTAEEEIKRLRKKLTRLPLHDSPQRDLTITRLVELEQVIQQPIQEPLRLFLQDTTAIAAADFMQKQPGSSLMIADAEGGSFDAILSDHRLLELLLSGFSNERISFERSSRASIDIASPHAGLCILTQEDKLHKLAKKTATWDEGFIPRSLIFLAREMAGYRSTAIGKSIPQEIEDFWKKKCDSFLDLKCQKDCNGIHDYYVLELSPEAALIWRNCSLHLESMMQPNTATYSLRAWLGKMPGVAARIAAIFHLFEENNPLNCTISGHHMQCAYNLIFIAQLHMAEVAKLYFPNDSTFIHAVHKIINWLKQEEGTIVFFKLRDMYRQLNIRSKLAHQACGHLINLGVLQLGFIQENTVGRNSSPVYSVNWFNLNTCFPLAQY